MAATAQDTAISRKVVGKMCTGQSRKVIWDMINTLFLTTVPVEAFRAEKRSAQASAHPLSQAQGGLFSVLTVFVCCWSSE